MPQGYGYQPQVPPQPSPYSGYGAPNQGYKPQQPIGVQPTGYGQMPPQSQGYPQMPQQPIGVQPTGYGQPPNMGYNMGYAPTPQPQQMGYGPIPQNYTGHQRPVNTPRPAANGRSNSVSGTEKLRRMFNGVDTDGKQLIEFFNVFLNHILVC